MQVKAIGSPSGVFSYKGTYRKEELGDGLPAGSTFRMTPKGT
jgi:hypothetical protein